LEIITLTKACELPESWNGLTVDYFQTREFLCYTEKYNSCNQRYYLLFRDGILQNGAVVYTLRLDLLTYLSIPSPFRMNIAGIPCSVSAGGIIGTHEFLPELTGYMKTREKGLLLMLNMETDHSTGNMISGKTLPTILIENRFATWEEYMSSLRADYRRRIIRISQTFSAIQKKQVPCSSFDEDMYCQYLEVLKRSKGKLETLTIGFFQNLPAEFNLTALYFREKLIGWYITASYRDKFSFFLGGIDYMLNKQYNTYFNILAAVVKEGIEKKASWIDLGQTAEIPKVRMGGKVVSKTMLAYHSNPVIRKLLHAGKRYLEYNTVVKETHVFKEIR
jgi:hypothetical protein